MQSREGASQVHHVGSKVLCAFVRGIVRNVELGREPGKNADGGLSVKLPFPRAPTLEHWCHGMSYSYIPSQLHGQHSPLPGWCGRGGESRGGEAEPAEGMAIFPVVTCMYVNVWKA